MTAVHTLTLSGSAADSVTTLKGTLDATGLTGALTAAFAGATQTATLGWPMRPSPTARPV